MSRLLFAMVIYSLLCNAISAQHLHRVNNNIDFDADFTTLLDAVTAASDNDTIYVEGSPTEYEGATIDKPLTIVGPGFFLSENPMTQANNTSAIFKSEIAFTSGSEGSSIMGCEFQFGSYLTIFVSDIHVIRNRIYQLEFEGTSDNILVIQNYVDASINAGTGNISNTIISNNIIKGSIYAQVTSGPLIVSNNVCWTTSYNRPIDCHNASIQNNIIANDFSTISQNSGNAISNNILAADGTNADGNQYNIDMNLVFADYDGTLGLSTDAKWELRDASPAIGAGSGGSDCGAFSSPNSYVLSGVPNLPHIYEADVPASATSDTGLQVSIKVKSGD